MVSLIDMTIAADLIIKICVRIFQYFVYEQHCSFVERENLAIVKMMVVDIGLTILQCYVNFSLTHTIKKCIFSLMFIIKSGAKFVWI